MGAGVGGAAGTLAAGDWSVLTPGVLDRWCDILACSSKANGVVGRFLLTSAEPRAWEGVVVGLTLGVNGCDGPKGCKGLISSRDGRLEGVALHDRRRVAGELKQCVAGVKIRGRGGDCKFGLSGVVGAGGDGARSHLVICEVIDVLLDAVVENVAVEDAREAVDEWSGEFVAKGLFPTYESLSSSSVEEPNATDCRFGS